MYSAASCFPLFVYRFFSHPHHPSLPQLWSMVTVTGTTDNAKATSTPTADGTAIADWKYVLYEASQTLTNELRRNARAVSRDGSHRYIVVYSARYIHSMSYARTTQRASITYIASYTLSTHERTRNCTASQHMHIHLLPHLLLFRSLLVLLLFLPLLLVPLPILRPPPHFFVPLLLALPLSQWVLAVSRPLGARS